MARMEPAWLALAPGTAAALLRCLAKLVAERTALPRVLPWLWPLATPEARALLSRQLATSSGRVCRQHCPAACSQLSSSQVQNVLLMGQSVVKHASLVSKQGTSAAAAAADAAAAAGAAADVRGLLGEALACTANACEDAVLSEEARPASAS